MITTILLFSAIIGAVIGYLEGADDAQTILTHRLINHAQGLAERIVFGLVFVALLGVIAERYGSSWWIIAPIACAYAGASGIVFRYALNRMRGLPWDYVSASNRYDTLFIGLFGKAAGAMEYAAEALLAVIPALIYYL